jgi:hypothetical protein
MTLKYVCARVVEGDGLQNRLRKLIVGSNPTTRANVLVAELVDAPHCPVVLLR